MQLGELLDELRGNMLYDRSMQVAGNASDQLWSDETLVRYINQAQRRFARQGLVIRDGYTPQVTQVVTRSGVNEYQLHQSVIAVISVRLAGDNADLARAGHSAFDTYRVPDTYFFDPGQLSSLPPGKPVAFATDDYIGADDDGHVSAMTLRLYPVPNDLYAGITAQMRVLRLPLCDFTLDNLTAEPEIPADHHMDMLDWAAYLALRIMDVDLGFMPRAMEYKASFEVHVKEARDLVMRKLFSTLQWGFGRNGWSWQTN